jgi:ferritin-like metal-binding protein YciE
MSRLHRAAPRAAAEIVPGGAVMPGKLHSLRELFEIGVCYAYDCETKLVEKGLPTMMEKAGSAELKRALEHHLMETKNHVVRLERVFETSGKTPDVRTNEIFDKMANAVKDSVANIDESPLRDAAMVVNGNLVEHCEIATYGSLAAFARSLGLEQVASLLSETLEEEKKADAKLTEIGERLLSPQAARYQTA